MVDISSELAKIMNMTTDESILRPLEKSHTHLRDVVAGKHHITVDLEMLDADLILGKNGHEIAMDIYEIDVNHKTSLSGFIKVNEPILVGKNWVVEKTLTQRGQRAFTNLDNGWLVDKTTGIEDVEKTCEFYREMMRRGSVAQEMAELLINNKDERLREVRSEFTYYKMTGNREGKFTVPMRKSSNAA